MAYLRAAKKFNAVYCIACLQTLIIALQLIIFLYRLILFDKCVCMKIIEVKKNSLKSILRSEIGDKVQLNVFLTFH